MGDNMALAGKMEEILQTGDFRNLGAFVLENGTDDYHEDWPQSGERLSKTASVKMGEVYAERSGTNPTFKYRRMIGGGDVFVVEGTIDYGDGIPVSYVGVGELRDGKIAHMTSYFANPFEAPAWRAEFVDRIEPVTA